MSPNREGRQPKVSDEEILSIFEDADEPVLMANEIADLVPIGRRAVYNRLKDLESEGVLESKKTGRSRIWWYPGHIE